MSTRLQPMSSTSMDGELVLRHADWDAALRSLLIERQGCAVGEIREHPLPHGWEWLATGLHRADAPPRGTDLLPLTHRVVVQVGKARNRVAAAELLAQIQPRASQTIVALLLDGSDRGHWEGLVHRDGRVQPLSGVRLIGPGMLHLRRDVIPDADEPLPKTGRWSRTIGALGPQLWRQVHNAHVLLIGCGRNGSLAAWQLAGLGVRTLTLVDPDQLELDNLDAMPGLMVSDVGQSKATALARRLTEFNPDLLVRCFTQPVVEALDRLQSRFDLIVTCLDNDAARLAAAWLARERLIPHLDIGTSIQRLPDDRLQQSGDVRLLLPHEGCIQCVGGLAEREETLYEFAAPPGSLHRGEPQAWHQQRAGSLVHLNAVTVGTAFELWLSLLSGQTGSFWQRLAWESGTGLDADGAAVGPHESCGFCRHPTS